MKNFILPGFYEKFNINSQLINLIENCPEIFHENIKISAIYGNMGFNIWEGGRVYLSYNRAYKEDMERIRDFYHEKNIPIRLTFTNPIVNKEHLNDSYCNLITSTFETGENEILVNSKILEEYLRIKYPNYKFCSSTTKCITNKEELKNEINSYF